GAIYFKGDNLAIQGGTTFTGNEAWSDGGAVYFQGDNLAIYGDTTFTGNEAWSDGGAIYFGGDDLVVQGSDNLAIQGDTTFTENIAYSHGGAIYSQNGSLAIQGDTTFTENIAYSHGGAICAGGDTIVIQGNTTFTENTADYFGGETLHMTTPLIDDHSCSWAVHMPFRCCLSRPTTYTGAIQVTSDSSVDISGPTTFVDNTAQENGGAVQAMDESSVDISGPTTFVANTAQGNGGAISISDSAIVTESGTTFTGNNAVKGGGGGVYCSVAAASFTGSVFSGNEAAWGGGMALFSSGSVWNKQIPDDSGPANTTACLFESNRAGEGGAIYSAAGYDMIKDSRFEDNFAGSSGGAYLHSGVVVVIKNATFVENRAGDSGLAIMSLGIVENMFDTTFESNTYSCPSGKYGYDIDEEDMDEEQTEELAKCRFDVVCSSCAPSCEEIPESVRVLNNSSVPICDTLPVGVVASGDGGTVLSTLNLSSGYFRTSAGSHSILGCLRDEACRGGVNSSDYCASGYHGVYCAACQEDYASGYQYSCSSCTGNSKRSAIGVFMALFLLALGATVLVIADLVRVLDENDNDRAFAWEKRLASCREKVVAALPLTSIKIVVVAWQIITQFSSVVNVVYPDVYKRFLAVLNLVNLNLGFTLSISCVVKTNFYGRLVFATISPLVVLGALAATYAVSRSRNRHSLAGMQAAKHKHLSIALFIMLVVYSSVSFNIFQIFVCDTLDDDVKYLRADYSLTCTTDMHTAMMAYAGLMIVVYPIGIPAVFTMWLHSNRNDLLKVKLVATGDFHGEAKVPNQLQPMRGLWAPYKPHRYYFEVVECGRRIALTGLAVFIYPGSAAQVALEVVLSAIFIGVSDLLSPFADPWDAWLYRVGAWVIFFTMFVALLLKVDASGEDSEGQEVFAGVLIAAHAGMVTTIVTQAMISVKRGLVAVREQPIANNSFRSSSVTE
ncbi:unnamed protein product, partial [Pylaiella littoralis]